MYDWDKQPYSTALLVSLQCIALSLCLLIVAGMLMEYGNAPSPTPVPTPCQAAQ